jgi:hypothetical protein
MRAWIGKIGASTWALAASVLIMALTVHPSLLAYLLVLGNGGWMLITRELARAEGATTKPCMPCLMAGIIIVCGVFVFALKINWLAV